MLFRNVTEGDLKNALNEINKQYNGNVTFNNFTRQGKMFRVTLRVVSSKGPGARFSPFSRRRLVSAGWHVHGDFFDALWKISPKMSVRTGGFVYERPEHNWKDKDIGSMMFPAFLSELCECNGNRKGVRQ